NLQVLLEPTETGQRIRFATMHGAARSSIMLGLAAWVVAGGIALGMAGGMAVGNAAGGFTFLGGLGLGFIANGVLRLPGWARTRRRQMDALAAEIALPRPAATAATIAGR
ncbi:MAG TPA: hypothetical protein VN947_04430, partial [Polyangia bacterium]|nr:hypothetical protein [Polyangia bacterium]